MKRLIPIALLLIIGSFSTRVAAQCTPDPDLNNTGFTPQILPFAYTDAPYNQVLSFYATRDTVAYFNGNYYDVTIDSVQLMSLNGVPKNFEYQCLNRCVVEGGNKGCALLTGQADSTQIGGYKLSIYLLTYFRLKASPANQFSRIDSGNSYTFRIYKTTGLPELVKGNAPVFIKAYPNPASNKVEFDLGALPAYSSGNITLFDALGRQTEIKSFINNRADAINIESYQPGVYKCLISTDQGNYYTTFLKE